MFSEFKPINKAVWLEKVKQDLKGKPLSDLALNIGGENLYPFCHPDDLEESPVPIIAESDWEIGEDILVAQDTNKTNRKLIAALESGVNAPRLVLQKNISYSSLAIILAGVNLEMVSLHFYFKNKNANPLALFNHLIKLISLKRIEMDAVNASFNWEYEKSVSESDKIELFEKIKSTGINLKGVTINGEKYFSENKAINELVEIIMAGEKLIDKLKSEKLSPAFINRHIQFSLPIGKNYFLQIAKIRALKLCWANILSAYQIEGPLPDIEAHLAAKSQIEDKNTNMIAATAQSMAAINGGAGRLTVLPSDYFAESTTDFSRRIARNVQHLLKMESGLDRVADPGAGSYFIEKLTALLAKKTWEKFAAQ
ncbi:MAG: methylmalonyl-CoA mutase family protein [Bacteroidota bacterium]